MLQGSSGGGRATKRPEPSSPQPVLTPSAPSTAARVQILRAFTCFTDPARS